MENSSRNEFYKAALNESEYHPVCEYKLKKGFTPKNVVNAFKGLECSEPELYQWNTKRSDYTQQFKKAKQCLERRLTRMKRYPANTNEQRETRKRHSYPIKVAYAFGKDCLKKMGSQRRRELFEKSVNSLVNQVAELRPDVRNYFGNSIEQSIRELNRDDYIKEVLDRQYYAPDIQDVINRERNSGLYRLSQANQDLYKSVFNEGFERNVEFPKLLQEANNENENEEENARNETKIRPAAITLRRRALRKKKKTLKKPKRPVANVRNLNTLLSSNLLRITNVDRKQALKTLIDKLVELYKSSVYIQIKNGILIKVNNGLINPLKSDLVTQKFLNASKETGIKQIREKIGIKQKQKMADVFMTKPEVKLFITFNDFTDNLAMIVNQNNRKLEKIHSDIDKILISNNASIRSEIDIFYNEYMDEYLLNKLYDEIDKLSDAEYDRISKDEKILYTSLDEINILTKELDKLQDVYDNIPRDITNLKTNIDTAQRKIEALLKLKEAIKNRPNRLASANSSLKQLLEAQELKLAELKELEESEPKILEKYYEQFRKRNTILQNISSEISKGIVNPIILSSFLENNLMRKTGLLNLLASMSSFNNSPSLLTNANNSASRGATSAAASAAANGSNV
jgi:hypothetical protein